jgi:SNF2 family DNA or RNA helicase
MSLIRISATADRQIKIEPIGDFDEDDWASAVHWWTSNTPYPLPSSVMVTPANFAYRKQWLRENWTNLGHKVELGEGVLDLVKSADALTKNFDALAGQEDRGSEISLEHLHLKRPLTLFQIKNLQALVTMPNGANFSVPGAGKTSTTLAVWEYFRRLNEISRLLVICPRSAFEAWKEEPSVVLSDLTVINQFTEDPIPSNTDILYVNYEQLENANRLDRLIKWVSQSPTMLVIDEAHRIKGGASSVRWRACLELSNRAARVDLLTGTPMPQSQEDLKNLFGLSWQGVPRYFFTDERLTKLKRGGVFVRTTKDELSLPPMRIETVVLPMSDVQGEIYTALKRSFIGKFGMSDGDQGYFGKRGKAVMSLIAAATNPGLLMSSINEDAYLGLQWPPAELSGSERLLHVLENYSLHEIPAKYEWVSRFVAKAAKEGRKVLVWSTFVGNLLALQRVLKPYEPALVYGATSPEDRASEIARFRVSDKCSVLLSNPQTLGEGVSLHKECHDAVYVDRSYNAGLYLQSLDRIHRLGLSADQTTNVYILESESSIDRNIARRLALKIDRLGTYLNDDGLVEVSLPSDEESDLPDGMLGLDDFDLNDLYEHLREENDAK